MWFMTDADKVGRKLASKIGSHKATTRFMEIIGVFIARVMPGSMERLMSGRAAAARKDGHWRDR